MIRLPRFVAALSVAALLAAPFAVFAQPAPVVAPPAGAAAPAHKHHHGSAYMRGLRSLNLSDGQRQQIKGLMQTARSAPKTTDPATLSDAVAAWLRSRRVRPPGYSRQGGSQDEQNVATKA